MNTISRKAIAKAFLSLLHSKGKKPAIQAVAALLVEQRRARDVDFLIQDVGKELFAADGELQTTVTTAHKLSEKTQKSITAFLRQRTGAKTVQADFVIDSSIKGGFIARTPVGEINTSVTQLLSTLNNPT